ncbi:MAG: hypothetical protein R3E96_09140 [Planctomycetota bacterium]
MARKNVPKYIAPGGRPTRATRRDGEVDSSRKVAGLQGAGCGDGAALNEAPGDCTQHQARRFDQHPERAPEGHALSLETLDAAQRRRDHAPAEFRRPLQLDVRLAEDDHRPAIGCTQHARTE